MNPELQKYYEERFSMMSTQGWIDLMEDVAAQLEVGTTLSFERFHGGEVVSK